MLQEMSVVRNVGFKKILLAPPWRYLSERPYLLSPQSSGLKVEMVNVGVASKVPVSKRLKSFPEELIDNQYRTG
jgi:hypothetical protein